MRDTSPIRIGPTRVDVPGRPRFLGSTGAFWPFVTWPASRGVLIGLLVEGCRYACGSPRSRLHQRAALRELDDRLLRDIGAASRGPDRVARGHRHPCFEGPME